MSTSILATMSAAIAADDASDITRAASVFILVSACVGILFAYYQFLQVRKVPLSTTEGRRAHTTYRTIEDQRESTLLNDEERNDKIIMIYNAIRQGADGFLFAEYGRCFIFMVAFALIGKFSRS